MENIKTAKFLVISDIRDGLTNDMFSCKSYIELEQTIREQLEKGAERIIINKL